MLELAAVDPKTVVERAIAPLRPRLDGSECVFNQEIAPSLPRVKADPDALAQVLTNILENAVKYSNPPRRVTLRVKAENHHVAFTVTDNGIGIPEEERRAIFKPFYQVDQKLSRTRAGCGLGLAIVRELVEAQNGSVEVASAPESGSVFTVKIPSA